METLFPHENFKAQDVAPGGRLYCLTQVFLDKIDSQDKTSVDLLFISRSSEQRFSKYQKKSLPAVSQAVADAFKKLTHEKGDLKEYANSLCRSLHTLHDDIEAIHPQIDERFKAAFDAVESCFRNHPAKLQNFEQLFSDWSKASPGMRARGTDFDPFIKEIDAAIQKIWAPKV